MKLLVKIIIIWISSNPIFAQNANYNATLDLTDNGKTIIDSLKKNKIETIVGYYRYSSHHSIALSEVFHIAYLFNDDAYHITLLRFKNSSFINRTINTEGDILFSEVILPESKNIFNQLKRSNIFNDTLVLNDSLTLIKELPDHGIGLYFYAKVNQVEMESDYCCNLDLNKIVFKRAPELWRIASFFNNYYLLEE